MILVLFFSALSFADTQMLSSARVQSSDLAEINSLRASLQTMSGVECPQPQRVGNQWNLLVSTCLPPQARRLVALRPRATGPNCFNFAGQISGLMDVARFVSRAEIDLITNPSSGICQQRQGPPRPGDFAMITSGEDRNPRHAYIYINDNFALTKNSMNTDTLWQLDTTAHINELFPEMASYGMGRPPERRQTTFYRCQPLPPSSNADVRESAQATREFSRAMEPLILTRPITQAMIANIESRIATLESTLTDARLQTLSDRREQADAKQVILELYSHLITLNYIDTGYESTEFESHDTKVRFLNVQNRCVDIANRVVERTQTMSLIPSGIFDSESSLAYEYCEQAQGPKRLCQQPQ